MRKLWLVFSLPLTLVACISPSPNFSGMSIEEIVVYNENLPSAEQVFYVNRTKLSSRILKRACNTLAAFRDESMNNAGLINTAGAGLPIFR